MLHQHVVGVLAPLRPASANNHAPAEPPLKLSRECVSWHVRVRRQHEVFAWVGAQLTCAVPKIRVLAVAVGRGHGALGHFGGRSVWHAHGALPGARAHVSARARLVRR